MVAVVLPTRDLVKTVVQYDHLFDFYGGGVKEFLVYHFQCSAAWNGEQERKDIANELVHKAWIDYDQYLGERGLRRTEQDTVARFNHLANVNEYMSKQVHEIMKLIFPNMGYEVSQMWWKWIDDDLVIKVDAWYA